ncbi:MAG: Abi family protein [Mitsuaria chitosanitabida]|uniref:Abi family protein n=1 Tax=Roseateles chitosanitabidus TaxID=65048 RepID=UPI001B02A9CE|nr:Abi family protein [Roseateles chitosanitabidus]MBO9688335.1 Abi family protein [Roseateles chitosanitabidus]
MIRGNTSPTSDPGESAVCHVGDLSFRSPRGSVRHLKPYTTTADQLALLRSRGLQITDEAAARSGIRRLGFYRLAGYAYPLKTTATTGATPGKVFRRGASFELMVALSEFDKALRLLVLHGLEIIEIAVRAAVVERLGKLDVEGHRNPNVLDGKFTATGPDGTSAHTRWLERLDSLCASSKEDFVDHHRQHYGGRMPVWAAAEVWEFGLLSRLTTGLQRRDQRAIARQFGMDQPAVLRSWMHMFNVIRNIAAHHGRLWNRANPIVPVLPDEQACPDVAFLHALPSAKNRLFGVLSCMRIAIRAAMPESDWHQQLKSLMTTFPSTPLVSMAFAGFPHDWQSLPLWCD